MKRMDLRGRHDRWSRDGARRVVAFAFLGASQAFENPGKFQRYVLGIETGVYFNESAEAVAAPQVMFTPTGLMATVRNPARDQHIFVEEIVMGGMNVLMARIPIVEFTHGQVRLDHFPLRPGEPIRVRVSCELVRRRRK